MILKGGFFFVPPISVKWVVPDSVVDAFNITCREGTASPASISVNSSDIGQTSIAYCTNLPLTGVHHWMSVVAISNGKQSGVSTAQVSCKLKFMNNFILITVLGSRWDVIMLFNFNLSCSCYAIIKALFE